MTKDFMHRKAADILSICCASLETSPDYVRSNSSSKKMKHVKARHLIYWVLRENTELTLTEISTFIGCTKDHSTVVHALNKMDAAIDLYKKGVRDFYAQKALEITQCLRNEFAMNDTENAFGRKCIVGAEVGVITRLRDKVRVSFRTHDLWVDKADVNILPN